MDQSTYEIIKAKLEEYLETPVEPHNTFADLGIDSLDQIELQMSIEEAFDIIVPEEQWEGVKTVSEAVHLVDSIKE